MLHRSFQPVSVSSQRAWRVVCIVLLSAWLSACSGIRLVADYDAEAAKRITDTSAHVFAFYDRLISERARLPKSNKLPYAPFDSDWGKIETEIRVMVVSEQARPLNSDSEAISEGILGFWTKYRESHRASGDYNADRLPIHRDRFQRLFIAALAAEKAKQLKDPDKSPNAATD